jgi:hypothetical protein
MHNANPYSPEKLSRKSNRIFTNSISYVARHQVAGGLGFWFCVYSYCGLGWKTWLRSRSFVCTSYCDAKLGSSLSHGGGN